MTSYQFQVENIKCMGCVNSIRENLMKIKGVVSVEVNQAAQQVTVHAIAVERKELSEKLNQLGYPVKGRNNLLQKAKSFIACTFQK